MGDERDIQVLKDKIDRFNKQAWENRVNDSTQAHTLSKEAIELAESINYTRGKAEGYRTFAFAHIRLSKHHEALEYLEKSLALFESLNDLNGQSSVYLYHGIIQRSFGYYAPSLAFLFKSLELSQQIGNNETECISYYHLGVTYKYLGDNDTSLNYLLQSLSACQTLSSVDWAKSYCLKQIGLIYFETGDFNNALEYDNQSLILVQQSGDKWGEAGCLDNIGFIYFKLNDYDKALSFCSQALSISRIANDKKGESNALFHLANIFKELADYEKASEYCNSCLMIRRDIEDKKGEAEVLLFLATLYVKENFTESSPNEAFELLDKALQLGEDIKAMDLLAKIHLSYYEISKHYNRYPEALSHIETHISLSKQIHSDAINQKIQNLEITHKAEKSRIEAETYRLRNNELLLENQQIVEVERSRLAKDLHDGLGGLLSGVKLTLHCLEDTLPEKGVPAFSKANNQLDTAIKEMRRVAHNLMPEALLKFGLGEAIQDYCDGINDTHTIKMKYTQIGSVQTLSQATVIVLYRIVQELANNAIKHAMAKNIFIQITKHQQGVTITVEDDGKGFEASTLPGTHGTGLKNIESRIDYLKGSWDIKTEKGNGTSITIEIPV